MPDNWNETCMCMCIISTYGAIGDQVTWGKLQSRRLNENQTRSNYKSQMNPYPWLLKYSVHTSPYHCLPYHDSVGAYLTILVLVLVLIRGRKDSSALLSRKSLQRIQKGFAKRQILLPETGWKQYIYFDINAWLCKNKGDTNWKNSGTMRFSFKQTDLLPASAWKSQIVVDSSVLTIVL